MPSVIRRFALLALITATASVVAPAPTRAADAVSPPVSPTSTEIAPTSTEIALAESTALAAVNRQRAGAGLIALRRDARIAAIARERAAYMAQTGAFSHVQGDGTSVFDLISRSGISWYGAGEIIAWNNVPLATDSASFAIDGWLGSAPHKAIVLSSGYNYAAFALAISPTTGNRYWAGIFLKGPDRTAAWSRVGRVSRTVVDARYTKVTVRWSGGDTRLQVLTAGLRYFQVQKRRDGSAWYDYGVTGRTSLTRTWSRGHHYEVRIRSRDRKGNWSSWKLISITP